MCWKWTKVSSIWLLYSVWVLGPFASRVYVTYHFWTSICNVIGYWRLRSVCYTSLFTSLVVTTISVYNVLRSSDVVSRSGPGSSLDLLLRSSFICVFVLSSVSLFCLCLFSMSLFSVSVRLPAAPQIECLRLGKKTVSFPATAVSNNLVA
jgi:hypothetical protein